ncbi:MAG: lysozyme [Sphingobium sp.]|nr:lysozyme [Sphingobium sp.]
MSKNKVTSAGGRALITRFEGEKLKSYLCPANVWTIGVGHTGKDVKPGMVISQAESQALLAGDLARFEKAVTDLARKTTQNQFDAMVSLAFNIGENAFAGSTLLRKHNRGDYLGAAAEFTRWNKAGGKTLAGLTSRRTAEKLLYGRKDA